jgi:hypothetical protein
LPKKIASIVVDEDDLSDCISIDEFGKRWKAEVKKRYERKTPTKKWTFFLNHQLKKQ